MSIKFPSLNEQMDIIQADALEVLPVSDLVGKIERSTRDGVPLVVKQGFDPTRADLHIGHAVTIRKLAEFQEMGHRVVFVVGDYTATIGDPSGRNSLRPQLSEDQVRENAETYAEQVFTILDPARTEVRYNSEWLRPLGLAGVLDLAAKYTVSRMLERDDFSNRMQSHTPIAIIEFMYPLLQAYDSVVLKADVELGGSDQKFNLMVARDIQTRYGQEPQVCFTMPILRGIDGVKKMSKSYDNYIGLSMVPAEQFGRTMSIPDTLLEEWFRLASGKKGLELSERVELAASDPYKAKRLLARDIVSRYHSEEEACLAEMRFDLIHKRKGIPDDVPFTNMQLNDPDLSVQEGQVLLHKLMVRLGIARSQTEARKLIREGAVSVNGQKFTDEKTLVPAQGDVVIGRGKHTFSGVRF